ncbi:hypothetical protein [Mycolicibacterium sp. HS_4_1]
MSRTPKSSVRAAPEAFTSGQSSALRFTGEDHALTALFNRVPRESDKLAGHLANDGLFTDIGSTERSENVHRQ